MKLLQLLVTAIVYVIVVVEGAAHFDPPFWLVATIIIGPFMYWLYAPMFRRRPTSLKEDERGCPPSLLDLLLEQPPRAVIRAQVHARIRTLEASAGRPGAVPRVPRRRRGGPPGDTRR